MEAVFQTGFHQRKAIAHVVLHGRTDDIALTGNDDYHAGTSISAPDPTKIFEASRAEQLKS
jgi:hypothetical protein